MAHSADCELCPPRNSVLALQEQRPHISKAVRSEESARCPPCSRLASYGSAAPVVTTACRAQEQ